MPPFSSSSSHLRTSLSASCEELGQSSRPWTPERKSLLICPLNKTPEARFQFPGFREIRSLLIELQDENKNRAVFDDEIEMLRALIRKHQISNPKDTVMLLKLLSEYFFYGIEEIFHEGIDHLKSYYPQIQRYMLNLPDASDFGPVLTPRGIQEILNFYEKHCQFPSGILSCQPVSSLPDLIKEMNENYQENAVRGWAVYSDDFEEDKHIVPVFSICQYGKTHVFIFDSQGHTLNPKIEPILSSSFQKVQWMRINPNVELYSYKEKRQRGFVECSMYSILDLKNLIEMHMDNRNITLVDFYQKNPEFCTFIDHPQTYGIYGPPFYEISHLIPAMMKPTQSLSQLKKEAVATLSCSPSYPVRRRFFGGDVIEKQQDPNLFYMDMEAYKAYNRDEILQNSYIGQHRLEYFVYLLTSILDEAEATEKAESSSSQPMRWAADYV